MSDVVGIPFGSYRLLRRLAKGGMAEVFLARQTGLEGFDRLVAVKRILPHLVASREFVAMFLDEARLAAQLRHPNVVHIYDFGKVAEHYFIAMEFVEGVTAGELIARAAREPLPFELVARIGADACAGLDHAHNLKDMKGKPLELVHRDVSPPNLLMSFDGAVKLVDFGIAKAQSCVEGTQPGVVKGKVAYMSPEQTQGMSLDGSSDVFSLGLVLWEMLAGRPATPRGDRTEAMRTIRDGKLTPIHVYRPDVPPPLAAVLDRALAPYPHERATALELGLALERFLKSSGGISHLELAQWIRDRFRATPALSDGPGATRQGTAATRQGTAATQMVTRAVTRAREPVDADATEISPPPFGVDGGTEVAVSVDVGATPRRRGVLFAGALAATLAIALVAIISRGSDPSAGDPDTSESPTALAAGQAPAPATPAPTAPAPDAGAPPATLEIATRPPGARVTVGDRAPIAAPVRLEGLEPGTHAIRVELAGHEHLERDITLAAGERRTLELALVPTRTDARPRSIPARPPRANRPPPAEPGKLSVRTTPYSEVFLGGRKLGTTPLANLSLPAGKHRLRFVNRAASLSATRTVTIRPGRTTRLVVKLR